MKRIKSKQEEERKRKRNTTIASAVLVVVLFASVFGFGLMNSAGISPTGAYEYKGQNFIKDGSFWKTQISENVFSFAYLPNETINPEISGELKGFNSYSQEPLYIYSEDSNALSEIYRNFQGRTLRIDSACLDANDSACAENDPIKDCSENFIIIKESEQTKITQEQNCVYIQGENLTKLSDEFLFRILEIK